MAKKDAEETEEGGGSKKKLIIIAAVLILLIGAGVGAFLFLSGDKEEKISPEEEQARLEKQAKEVGPMVSIDGFIINILDDEESRYLKAAITLEVDSEEASMEINSRMPQLKDAILLLIGNKTFGELNDLQGKIQLRAELINKINSILLKGKVKRIYFTDFVVQ
ncbi:flagellar basal body-associated FliL family protein [uncultured Desulfuromusa sp.]|uniref:flagellar basal body-associated FliL family protein n=1 Tax=uncultured Desulfuromusa sp. TaxID=219183 RepID=UPI002AA7D088|nr:flagellar basal body-associated FliL family protein [uncultured Desulfuromusa sp.]